MGGAALALGIIGLIFACIPFCTYFGAFLAFIGLILGIVALLKRAAKDKPKGKAIAAIIFNTLALGVFIVWVVLILVIGVGTQFIPEQFQEYLKYLPEIHAVI